MGSFVKEAAKDPELIAARDGKSSLLAKEIDQDAAITSVTDEVVTARGVSATLLAKLDTLGSGSGDSGASARIFKYRNISGGL